MTDTTNQGVRNRRIVIVGAGPGGLMAARILQQAGIPVEVYDSDAAVDAREQGGTLDIHADSGQIAIEAAGLSSRFAELARPESQAHRLLAPDGTVLRDQVPMTGEDAAPEIDRTQLRQMLVDSLEPGTVRWGHRVEEVRDSAVVFTDGSSVQAALVIGADGAWSRVRRALTSEQPRYLGVSMVEALFTAARTRHPLIAQLVGDGHMWANGDGKNLVLQRNSQDVIRGYIAVRTSLDWLAEAGLGQSDGRGRLLDANGTVTTDTEGVRALLGERFADFSPELRTIITESEGALPNRPVFALPTPMTWQHRPGITLLVDAAHVMAPFGGNGVNLALLDAAELAQAIITAVRSGSTLDGAISRYEGIMISRGARTGEGANTAMIEHYRAGGPDVDSIPDFDDAAVVWKENAVAYRQSH
ncbi:FAD-dependent oxidoreductase [Corynebacterium nuruki]|uniref:FAD-dependent oxidoreductase n=1 Tax=Corynebacterium nuruki TaxID=1032851 RepID=UPI00024876C6|nr:NAD(P)/FAD-dependent oxidoreductase [Corynebacterium nuruki]